MTIILLGGFVAGLIVASLIGWAVHSDASERGYYEPHDPDFESWVRSMESEIAEQGR